MVVFDDEEINSKFWIIDDLHFSYVWGYVPLEGFIYPLLTCLAYIYLTPYPSLKVYEFWRHRQNKLSEKKIEIEKERLLTLDQSRKIISDSFELQEKHREELAKRDEYINILKSQQRADPEIEKSHENLNETIINVSEETPPLTSTEVEMLRNIGINTEGTMESALLYGSNDNQMKAQYDIDNLIRKKLIHLESIFHNNRHVTGYKISVEGRRILVEQHLE